MNNKYIPRFGQLDLLTEDMVMDLQVILDKEDFIRETEYWIVELMYNEAIRTSEADRKRTNRKLKALHDAVSCLDQKERDLLAMQYMLEESGLDFTGHITAIDPERLTSRELNTRPLNFDALLSATNIREKAGTTYRKRLARAARFIFGRYGLPIDYKEDGNFIAYLTILCEATGLNSDPEYPYLKKLAQDSN